MHSSGQGKLYKTHASPRHPPTLLRLPPPLVQAAHPTMLAHVLVSALAARLVLANPVSSPPVVHEARTVLPGGWASLGLPSPSAPLNLRLGLAQSNMDRLDEFLMAVSHPESPSYGQHWTPAQVAQAFAPAPETVDAVRAWLKDMDVDPARVHLTVGNVWLELNATVAEAEKLLSTTYKVYAHESGIQKIGTFPCLSSLSLTPS